MKNRIESMKAFIRIGAFLVIGMISISGVYSQKYMTKNGLIKFYSETPMETIEATNNQVNAALDSQTGDLVFKVLVKSFNFEKAMMQEHFNESYMESDKFPNSTFQGKITDITAIDFSKEGTYEAVIEGNLTIHGITKKISEKGTFKVNAGDKVSATSTFNIIPSDYSIKIPELVVKNIAEAIEVTVNIELSKMQ